MITFALATTVSLLGAADKSFGPPVSTTLFDQALYCSIEYVVLERSHRGSIGAEESWSRGCGLGPDTEPTLEAEDEVPIHPGLGHAVRCR